MKNVIIACALSLLASNSAADWAERYQPLSASYLIYSGEPGERAAPTRSDRKLTISVRGDAAREIFDAIAPDVKGVACTAEDGERLRRKGEIWCSYRPSDGYKCFMGFDLRTGKPHAGASC